MIGTTFKSTLTGAGTHTDALGLIQNSVNVQPAPVRTRLIEIPHRNGSLDVTEFLGNVEKGDRLIEWEFTVRPKLNFAQARKNCETVFHGRRFYIVLDEEPNFAYYGRVTLTEYQRDKALYIIRMQAVCEPERIAL